jgi:hypothetical protein
VDAHVTLAYLSAGGAGQIGAEYGGGVQEDSPLLAWLGACQEGVCLDPHFCYTCASPPLSVELPLKLIIVKIMDMANHAAEGQIPWKGLKLAPDSRGAIGAIWPQKGRFPGREGWLHPVGEVRQ